MRTRIAARREEIAALDGDLRDTVGEKRLLDVLPSIERLLMLKPDHAFATELAEQVRDRLIHLAERRLAEYCQDEALQLLDRIPPHCRSPKSEELRRQAAELAWLGFDLRKAPVVDATLVAIGTRLRQLTPNDPQVAALDDEVRRRAKQAQRNERGADRLGASAEETPLGVAVEGLAAFRRIACTEAAASEAELLRSPGRFAVACGLGLAGLKRAALQVNLLAGQQRGMLSRASRLIRSHGDRAAWGLDLGMSGLKAVKLSWNEPTQQPTIEAASLIEYAKPLGNALNEADEQKLITGAIAKFLERHRPKAERICVGLPGRMVLMRQFKLPPVEPSKTPNLIEFEARQQFPFPLEQLAWDYCFFDEADSRAGGTRNRSIKKWRTALLIASQEAASHRFLGAFRRQNISVDILQADFIALHSFLVHEYWPTAGDSPVAAACPAVAAVDVGCDVTNLVVSSPRSLWFRGCGVAGHSFTRALVKEFKLSMAQAEQRKRSPESSERLSDLYEAMSPVFEDILGELRQALAAYAEAHPDQPIQRVLGTGGGFLLHGLLRYLWHGR